MQHHHFFNRSVVKCSVLLHLIVDREITEIIEKLFRAIQIYKSRYVFIM